MNAIIRHACAAAVTLAVVAAAPAVVAQSDAPRSAALAKELAGLLEQKKLDSIAARDPEERDRFYAAMHYPGQLMVVSGRYEVPVLLDEKISFGKFMDVYMALNGAAMPDTKVFIEDQFADGLTQDRKDQPYDSWEDDSRQIYFDGEFRKYKMSRDEYRKFYADAEARYTRILQLLVAQARGAGAPGL